MNKKFIATITIVSFLFYLISPVFVLPVFATSTTVTVIAVKDAWIDQNDPARNHGAENELKVKSKDNNDNHRALVAFDLPSLPSGAVIESAKLKMFLKNKPSQSRTYEVYRITADWVEGNGGTDNNPPNEVRWNNQPSITSSSTASILTGTTSNVTLEWDVTSDVAAFYAGTFSNYGWMIKDANENSQQLMEGKFSSREENAASKRPQLEIKYNVVKGSISGTKFHDLNGNGVKDDGEPGLSGWTINLSGPVSTSTLTDQNGNYSFNELVNGNYIVCEELQTNWTQTFPINTTNCQNGTKGYNVTISGGNNISNLNFGNLQYGSITIVKVSNPDQGSFSFSLSGPTAGQTTINGSGSHTFENLLPGQYTLTEITPEGWNGTSTVSCSGGKTPNNLTLESGENITCTFNNTEYGVITGKKFHDLNANGVDDNDPGLSGWKIELYQESSNTLLDVQETNENGVYVFSNLSPDSYLVCEQQRDGWIKSYPDGYCHSVTLGAGEIVSFANFGNYQYGSISGMKFEDLNGNGQFDDGEPKLSGWTIGLYKAFGGVPISTTTTNEDGVYVLSNVKPDPDGYIVKEDLQEGWIVTFPSYPGIHTINLSSGEEITGKDFGNFKIPLVVVLKWHDIDIDGIHDEFESLLNGWKIALGKVIQPTENTASSQAIPVEIVALSLTGTDGEGKVIFPINAPGHYVVIEEKRDFWHNTFPANSSTTVFIETNNIEQGNTTSTFPAGSFFDSFFEFEVQGSGQTIDKDKNNRPLEFGNIEFVELLGGKFAPVGGNSSSTPTAIVLGTTTINVGSSTISIPDRTAITRVDGENFDINAIDAEEFLPHDLSGFATGTVVDGALRWGLANLGLQFSLPITVSIFVGTELNGQTLNIVRSTSGVGDWTNDGIEPPATCIVTNGFCVFQATKASYYAAIHTSQASPAGSSSSSGSSASGGSGGGGTIFTTSATTFISTPTPIPQTSQNQGSVVTPESISQPVTVREISNSQTSATLETEKREETLTEPTGTTRETKSDIKNFTENTENKTPQQNFLLAAIGNAFNFSVNNRWLIIFFFVIAVGALTYFIYSRVKR